MLLNTCQVQPQPLTSDHCADPLAQTAVKCLAKGHLNRFFDSYRVQPRNVLTDVVGGLLHGVGLKEVVSQHKSSRLHGVEELRGRVQLLAGGELPPRRLGSWLQQIIHRLHHRLGQQWKHRGHTEESAPTPSSLEPVRMNANPFIQ